MNNIKRIILFQIILCLLLLNGSFSVLATGGKSTKPSSPSTSPGAASGKNAEEGGDENEDITEVKKHVYKRRYVLLSESDLSPQQKERAKPFDTPLVGDFSKVYGLASGGEGGMDLKPLFDYLIKESGDHHTFRINSHPTNFWLRWMLTPASRESRFYPFTVLKDTFLTLHPDVVSGLLGQSFGTNLVKKDLFTIVRIILGPLSLFGSDSSQNHAEKRRIFKNAFSESALSNLNPRIVFFANRFVSVLGDSLPGEKMRSEVGKFLMGTIISIVFGFDITSEKYNKKFLEIRKHFDGVVEASARLPFDYRFQMQPDFLKEIYLRSYYSDIFEKGVLLVDDVTWLIETAQREGVLNNIEDTKIPENGGALLRAYVRKYGYGNLTEEHKRDLLNPMIAGTDTGSLFEKAVLTELGRKKDIQDKIRKEMIATLKKYEIPVEDYKSHVWTVEQLSKDSMRALHLFLEEVLLDLPPVPIDSRRVKDDFTTYFEDVTTRDPQKPKERGNIKTLHFRKGETVTFPIYYINPRKRNKNPHMPSGMTDLPTEERVAHMQSFVNSSITHACVGQYFVRRLVKIMILNILSSGREISIDNPPEEYELSFKGTIHFKDDLTVKFSEINLADLPESSNSEMGSSKDDELDQLEKTMKKVSL